MALFKDLMPRFALSLSSERLKLVANLNSKDLSCVTTAGSQSAAEKALERQEISDFDHDQKDETVQNKERKREVVLPKPKTDRPKREVRGTGMTGVQRKNEPKKVIPKKKKESNSNIPELTAVEENDKSVPKETTSTEAEGQTSNESDSKDTGNAELLPVSDVEEEIQDPKAYRRDTDSKIDHEEVKSLQEDSPSVVNQQNSAHVKPQDSTGGGTIHQRSNSTSSQGIQSSQNSEAAETQKEASNERTARLSKLVDGLRKKVSRLQNENSQLEDMVSHLDMQNNQRNEEIKKLNASLEQLMKSKQESEDRAAVSMKQAHALELTVKSNESEIVNLKSIIAEKDKENVNASVERNASETHIISSLRKDVEAAESMLEDERKAHAASRRAFASREQEIDNMMAEAADSLAENQRKLDDYTSKLATSQERCSLLENEIESLTQQLEVAKLREGEEKNTETMFSQGRIKELEEQLSITIRNATDIKSAIKSMEDDNAHLIAENIDLKRRLAKLENSDANDLRRRLQEVTDALYSKQSQIEKLSSEKEALQMQVNRYSTTSSADTMRRRSAAVDRVFSGADEYETVVPMKSLGAGYDRLASAPGHLGGAIEASARFLDTTASHAVFLLRQYPLWRLGVFAYVIGMHMFIYMLLHRLQTLHAIDTTNNLHLAN
eukprot:jgi/Picsp_1/2254/NSC_05718-R1_golgin candidate 1